MHGFSAFAAGPGCGSLPPIMAAAAKPTHLLQTLIHHTVTNTYHEPQARAIRHAPSALPTMDESRYYTTVSVLCRTAIGLRSAINHVIASAPAERIRHMRLLARIINIPVTIYRSRSIYRFDRIVRRAGMRALLACCAPCGQRAAASSRVFVIRAGALFEAQYTKQIIERRVAAVSVSSNERRRVRQLLRIADAICPPAARIAARTGSAGRGARAVCVVGPAVAVAVGAVAEQRAAHCEPFVRRASRLRQRVNLLERRVAQLRRIVRTRTEGACEVELGALSIADEDEGVERRAEIDCVGTVVRLTAIRSAARAGLGILTYTHRRGAATVCRAPWSEQTSRLARSRSRRRLARTRRRDRRLRARAAAAPPTQPARASSGHCARPASGVGDIAGSLAGAPGGPSCISAVGTPASRARAK